jgi:hypothetical protein
MCQQLADVATALVATNFPGAPAYTPSSVNPPLQLRTSLAPLWHQISQMLQATSVVYKQVRFQCLGAMHALSARACCWHAHQDL